MVSLDVGQKGEFLEEEFVAHETLEGLTVVSSSKMDLKRIIERQNAHWWL